MRVRSARNHTDPLVGESVGQGSGAANHPGRVVAEGRRHRLLERNGLGGDAMLQRTSLHHREDGFVDGLGVLCPAQDHGAPRSAQRLVGGERHHVGEGHRSRIGAAGDEPDEVRRVHHEQGPHFIRDLPERREVDDARVRGEPGQDQPRPMLEGQVPDTVHVDQFGVLVDLVPDEAEPFAGEVDRRSVREMPTMGEHEAKDLLVGVVRFQERAVHGHVGLGACVRLDVGVIGAEQSFGPFDGEGLRHVDELAPSVVAAARISLGVLVVHGRGQRRQHGRARVVLRGDQPERGPFPVEFVRQRRRHLRIGSPERLPISRELVHGAPLPSYRNRPAVTEPNTRSTN